MPNTFTEPSPPPKVINVNDLSWGTFVRFRIDVDNTDPENPGRKLVMMVHLVPEDGSAPITGEYALGEVYGNVAAVVDALKTAARKLLTDKGYVES